MVNIAWSNVCLTFHAVGYLGCFCKVIEQVLRSNWSMETVTCRHLVCFLLDVRSLAAVSRSRESLFCTSF